MCQVLNVSTSGYYDWQERPPSKREQQDKILLRQIQKIHQAGRGTYGSPKIHKVLRQMGYRCGRNRVIRLRKQAGLRANRMRCFKRTTRRNQADAAAPNLLKQRFEAKAPNQIWLADITGIPTQEGWLYLAAVLDLFSRRVVGWAMDDHMRDELTQNALEMAIHQRSPGLENLMHHSDRGSQYTSGEYQALLADHGITVSMSGTGNCYDNAPMESFFSLLKTELVHHERYQTRQEAKISLFDYIECFYNRQRVHSSIDFMSPERFEQRWRQTTASQTGGLTSVETEPFAATLA